MNLLNEILWTSFLFGVVSSLHGTGAKKHASKRDFHVKGGDRIVNGENSNIDQHPWIVYLQITHESGDTYKCGGTIVGDNRVVTARHCLADKGEHDEEDKVVKGKIHMGKTDQPNDDTSPEFMVEFTHENIQLHPNKDVDVACLNFTDKGIFTKNPNIAQLRVPKENDVAEVGGWGIVAGWGDTYQSDYKSKSAEILQELNITVYGMASCNAKYLWQFCAMGPYKSTKYGDGSDSCQGDSGGPVECNTKNFTQLCGVVSEGPKKCGIYPGTYVQAADPEVRWFILGNYSEKPDYTSSAHTPATNHFIMAFSLAISLLFKYGA